MIAPVFRTTTTAVAQELEVFGQRGVRRRAAGYGYARAAAGVANATRLTIGDVDRAFYRLVYAARRAQLADEVLALNQRLSAVTQRQLAEGEISRLDFNLATVEVGRSRSRSLTARREQEEQAIELDRLIGLPRGTPIAPVLDASEHAPAATNAAFDGAPSSPSSALSNMKPGEPTIPVDAFRLSERARALDIDSLTALALRHRHSVAGRARGAGPTGGGDRTGAYRRFRYRIEHHLTPKTASKSMTEHIVPDESLPELPPGKGSGQRVRNGSQRNGSSRLRASVRGSGKLWPRVVAAVLVLGLAVWGLARLSGSSKATVAAGVAGAGADSAAKSATVGGDSILRLDSAAQRLAGVRLITIAPSATGTLTANGTIGYDANRVSVAPRPVAIRSP